MLKTNIHAHSGLARVLRGGVLLLGAVALASLAFGGVPVCGNGVVEPGEQCDDGNHNNFDGCSEHCTLEICGNGTIDASEQCDDGNNTDGDGCSAKCTIEGGTKCGNGVVEPGEQCDDGNNTDGDGCSSTCKKEFCGDGVTQPGEECDDGNNTNGDGCRSDCTVEKCGNGTLDSGEQCDDGNNTNGDGCSSDCTIELCGNGTVDSGEQCDDGNTIDDDACRNDCTCPGETPSVCANPAVGTATGCTVLELNGSKVDMTGPAGGILGDVCIGPNGKLSMSGSQLVSGAVLLAPGATFSHSGSTTVGSVVQDADLTDEIADAKAAAVTAAGQPCTQTIPNLNTSQTITGGPGQNVVCVQNVDLSGKVITLDGGPTTTFIFNVAGKFKLSGGSKILVSGDVEARDVLYNVIGTGEQVAFSGGGGGASCCNSVVDGTILAVNRKIALSPGRVNGAVISGLDISIVSGSSVQCPPAPPCPAP